MPPPEVGSPLWWVKRLEKKLDERRPAIDLLNRYYEGDHPLPIAHEKVRDKFRRMLAKSRANWVALVVDAVAERLQVEGFRIEGEIDNDAWDLWQRNDLDAEGDLVHNEGLVCGETYVTVWADPDDTETPLITPEHASQMIHEYDPARPRRLAAALKVWLDDWTGEKRATLYLPEAIHKFSAPKSRGVWTERDDERLDNPLKTVPVAVFRNRPRLMSGGRSEIDDLLDIQDRINKTLFDLMMAAEYSSYRQRYSIGLEIPRDDDGNPKAPFEAAVDRLWMAEDPDVKFGEFSATDLEPYLKAVESDVNAMAAISRTPPHYLLGAIVNISGDALKAAESGLSSKAAKRCLQFGEAWERVMRLAFSVLDDPRAKVTDSEVIWRDVETRTEGERVDALVKMATLGVPKPALWERWGATPQEIERWRDMQFEEDLAAQAGADVRELTGGVVPGAPEQGEETAPVA